MGEMSPPRHVLSTNEAHDIDRVHSTIDMAPDQNFSQHSEKPIKQSAFSPFLLKMIVAELIATFMLVFVTCGAAALHVSDQTRVSQLGASAAAGLIVTVMIYTVGHISGAHMNPAVTLAFAATKQGRFPWIQVPFYWMAQIIGATISAFSLKALLNPIKNIGTTTPSGSAVQALVMEIVISFFLMLVNAAVGTDNKAVGELAGLAVGCFVCIASIFAGPVSGGSMNPARTLGPALASNRFNSLWVYFLGPAIGTVAGMMAYNFIRLDKFHSKSDDEKKSSFKLQSLENYEAHNMNASEIL